MKAKADFMVHLTSKAIAEGIGTFAVVFAGCGSAMVIERFPGTLSPLVIPVIFGAVVATMIYAMGHISGAHFNPAVTLAFAISRHFPKKEVIVYWLAQFIGSLLAIGLLSILLPVGKEYGATITHVSTFQTIGWEIVLTFFLMFVIIAVATDTRAEGTMAGIAIGMTVMFCAFVGGPVTGASMNPARSLAPAIFQGTLNNYWLYFISPMIGAVLAAITYSKIRCEPENKDAKGCC